MIPALDELGREDGRVRRDGDSPVAGEGEGCLDKRSLVKAEEEEGGIGGGGGKARANLLGARSRGSVAGGRAGGGRREEGRIGGERAEGEALSIVAVVAVEDGEGLEGGGRRGEGKEERGKKEGRNPAHPRQDHTHGHRNRSCCNSSFFFRLMPREKIRVVLRLMSRMEIEGN